MFFTLMKTILFVGGIWRQSCKNKYHGIKK